MTRTLAQMEEKRFSTKDLDLKSAEVYVDSLREHLDSLNFAAPEMFRFWLNVICTDLSGIVNALHLEDKR